MALTLPGQTKTPNPKLALLNGLYDYNFQYTDGTQLVGVMEFGGDGTGALTEIGTVGDYKLFTYDFTQPDALGGTFCELTLRFHATTAGQTQTMIDTFAFPNPDWNSISLVAKAGWSGHAVKQA